MALWTVSKLNGFKTTTKKNYYNLLPLRKAHHNYIILHTLQFMKETFKTGKQRSQQKLPHMDKAGVDCKAVGNAL